VKLRLKICSCTSTVKERTLENAPDLKLHALAQAHLAFAKLEQPLLQALTHHPRRQVPSHLRQPVHQQPPRQQQLPPQLEIQKDVPSLRAAAASMVSHGAMRATLSSLQSGAKIVQEIVQTVTAFGAQTQIASDVCSSKIEMFDVYHFILDAVWWTS